MPKILFTRAFVSGCSCPTGARKVDFYDVAVRGLLLEVRRSGGKTYYLRYRDRRGKERQFKIGSANVVTLGQVRRRARALAAEAIVGSDPHESRRVARAIPSLADFVRDQYLPYVKLKKRSWKTDETILRIHILPSLGRLPLDDVSGLLVAQLLNRLKERKYSSGTTNRVLILLRYCFNLAKRWDTPGVGANPTSDLRTVPDVCCERYLSHEEAQRLLITLERDQNQGAAKAIKLLLLTGARRNEITHAEWKHVDFVKKILFVPIAKSGKARQIALNSEAIALLQSVDRIPGNPYVFPSPITGNPSASLYFPWNRVRIAAGLAGVRLHDLRHSFASFLVNKGVSLYVVQGLLGHTQPRMTQRYAHLSPSTLADAADLIGQMFTRSSDAASVLVASEGALESKPLAAQLA